MVIKLNIPVTYVPTKTSDHTTVKCFLNSIVSTPNAEFCTADIEKFYHRVSPRFLLRPAFLKAVQLSLSSEERRFTEQLLAAMSSWYKNTPDFEGRPEGAIPVGLSASKIIANVLLVESHGSREVILSELNELSQVCQPDTKVIVIGHALPAST